MLKSFANGARAVLSRAPGAFRDLLGLSGAGLVSYGAWLIYPPAGYITGGVLLLTGAVISGLGATPPAPKAD